MRSAIAPETIVAAVAAKAHWKMKLANSGTSPKTPKALAPAPKSLSALTKNMSNPAKAPALP